MYGLEKIIEIKSFDRFLHDEKAVRTITERACGLGVMTSP